MVIISVEISYTTPAMHDLTEFLFISKSVFIEPTKMGNKHSENTSLEEFLDVFRKEGLNVESSLLLMFRVSMT